MSDISQCQLATSGGNEIDCANAYNLAWTIIFHLYMHIVTTSIGNKILSIWCDVIWSIRIYRLGTIIKCQIQATIITHNKYLIIGYNSSSTSFFWRLFRLFDFHLSFLKFTSLLLPTISLNMTLLLTIVTNNVNSWFQSPPNLSLLL